MANQVGKIELKIENLSPTETLKYQEILTVLITSGALNLRNGNATLHFDGQGVFQGVELDFWAFKRKAYDADKAVPVSHT